LRFAAITVDTRTVSESESASRSVPSVRSQLWTAESLSKHVFPQLFLIEPIIPREGIVFCHGKRNIGKSQLVFTLLAALTEHGALWGRYPTHLYGPIIYVQADMSAHLQQMRLHRAQDLYSLSNVYFFFPRFFNLAQVDNNTQIIKDITSLKPAVIFWDTLRKVQRLGTNDDDVPSFIYGKVQEMFPQTTHFFIHHDRKTTGDDTQGLTDPEEHFRGSGAWLDDADTGLHLSKVGSGRLLLTFTKTRSCEQQAPLALTLHPETLLLYATGEGGAERLKRWWQERHSPDPRTLEQFLNGSFVASPKIVKTLVYGDRDE
jgi:AAA domain-containing protein